MPLSQRMHRICRLLAGLLAVLPGLAAAQTYGNCIVSTASPSLGSMSSFAIAAGAQQASGASGLACTSPSLIGLSFMKVAVVSSTFTLTGGAANQAIPFTVSATPDGPPLGVGAEQDFSALELDVLGLFGGPGGSLPLYFRTVPTAGLRAGTYTGSVNLRWYFSVCTGIAVLCTFSNSPGFTRGLLNLSVSSWGSGVPVSVNLTLVVENDCALAAPALDFGTAPLAASFPEVTRTITVRCTTGAAYTVGLGDGNHFSAGARRMRRGATSDYLRYEIYQGPGSNDRWGSAAGERRSSAGADANPGVYDATTEQGFTYRARIDPSQDTPPTGVYTDNIVVDVQF